eukprot:TRINITY_DN97221_c0_g1_i1.p1 TRINITY_DN97221_c0_g1~~TRINITY_DN97221_c0_g1_i1.p1  ORF type:complete len:369 (-),score=47.17 TRINITY_DN97221_c0_g1_i1:82-1140(-)
MDIAVPLDEASISAALIGAALMIGKTLIIVIGLQIISHAARIENPGRQCRFKTLGMTLAMLIGPLTEVTAYAFAPQALLAPLNGFDVVWNILLAPYTLGEELNWARGVGTAVVFSGCVFAPIVGPHAITSDSLKDLRVNFLSTRFEVYVATFWAIFFSGFIWLKQRKQFHSRGKDLVRGALLGIGGGAVAGQTYFLSAAATLVRNNIDTDDWSAWRDWLPYFTVGGAIVCALLNAVLLNKGLAEFEAMFFVPMFAGSAIIAACISAVVVLRETINLSYVRMGLYWFGVTLVTIGLAVLAWDARRRIILQASIADPSSSDSSTSTPLSPQEQELTVSCQGSLPSEESAPPTLP